MKPDQIFENAVAAVRDEPIDASSQQAALDRVARRLAAAGGEGAGAAADHQIHGCEGFRALLGAYRAGALAEGKRLLVEDHLRECVPCRRALRDLARGAAAVGTVRPARRRERAGRARFALAAGLAAVAVGATALWLAVGGAAAPRAEVRALEGELFALAGDQARPLSAGAVVEAGQVVRTAGASRAVLALADGTRLELAPRSEISLGRRRDGAVIELGRGNVIVEAAEQPNGHLYVATDDCTVAVVGTIFSVHAGARGSRVSVLDGEVEVRHGAELAVLKPGDQVATSARLARVPLEREIAWSRNAPAYRQRIAALAELGRELDRALEVPADRTSTRLLDLAPADTAIYAALPNLAERLAEAWATLGERAAENPALGAWWRGDRGAGGENGEDRQDHGAADVAAALERLRAIGAHLGAEVVIAAGAGHGAGRAAPVVLAEIADRRGLEAALDAELARTSERAAVRRVEDPATAVDDGDALLVWLAPQDVLVASPSAARLAAVAADLATGRSAFAGTPFHARLAEVYERGAGWLLAFDVRTLVAAAPHRPDDERALAGSGFDTLEHVVLESRTEDGTTEHHALVAFGAERRGIASWLAEPASSGALEFVSPDAALAVGGLLKEPVAMLDDLAALVRLEDEDARDRFAEAERELGLSLREDLAATLGGDFAVALDGPWLPQPSWKLVVEVVDPAGFANALERLTEACNRQAAEKGRPELVWREEVAGGRVYRTLAVAGGRDLAHTTVVDGYLLAGPSRALLADSIARRAAGASLVRSRAFLDQMPSGTDPDFSAMVWQNLSASAGELGRLLDGAAELEPGERDRLWALAAATGPSLAVALAGDDRVTLAARGAHGPLGISFESLFSLLGLAEAHVDAERGDSEPDAAVPAAVETQPRAAA